MLGEGNRLGSYEILAPLGTGGMGEVYRARDMHLGRTVAIKILPSSLSADSGRLQRFESEARSASALNHPNIITIHELGRDGSTHYIAMEMVEGRTLRELFLAGPVPARRALEIAVQIAEGLTKAHEAGIVHRDLKPENLMLSDDGFVKILDFGLAKLVSTAAELRTLSPTSAPDTAPGAVIGTIGYMSPEQVNGEEVDYRADQFSLGVVLYELITGKRAFHRKTAAETLVAILREEPEPLAKQNHEAPAPFCWVIERCMEKSPQKRYLATRDLARELAEIRDRYPERPAYRMEARPANLPVQRTGFVGRQSEIKAATELLLCDDVRLLTITGPGGIGKSRLALVVAAGVADRFPGGTHFVPLYSLSDPALLDAAIGQALGLRESGGHSPRQALQEYFQHSPRVPVLVLLDNFEHLAQAASTVSELLTIAPQLKILATSRAALKIYGEHELPIAPLAVPESKHAPVQELEQSPAVALFLQRAAAAKTGFELNRENAAAVAEICARLDGLPLAIELAAARLKVLSPAALLARLENRLQLLTGGARDLPERQQTLRAAMDWSYDLLTPAEQQLFRRLSVFVGGCNLEAAEAVCNLRGDLNIDLLDGMASIVDKSLVQQVEQGREPRFVMLETIREYAQDKLEAGGETALTRRAHAAYFLVLAEEEASDQRSMCWLERLTEERGNFRTALEWLTETGDAEWGLRLATALFRFWEMCEHLAEGRESLRKLLRLKGAAEPTTLRARALFAAGVLAGAQGDYSATDALLQESLAIARHLNDKHGTAISLNAMAVVARDQGNLEGARSMFEQSLQLWRESQDQLAIARSLSNLANVVALQRDYVHAGALYSECHAIFQQLGDRAGVAWSLNHQGDVARDQGDSAAARSWYKQALEIFRDLDDRWGIAGTLADLGTLAREERNYASAHALYRESIKIFQELEHKRGIARLLEQFACSAAEQRDVQRSLRLAGAAAALRQNIGAPLTPAEQVRLDSALEHARRAMANTGGASAWLQGWNMPVEKAIEEVLAA